MRIVTRRKTYGAPHGKGEEEWQAVADELNDAVGATFSFRACRDKVAALVKEHKRESADVQAE
ncbi:hypothetical protein PHMEG_00037255 [Phytophthora megakarya]|uniref:Uncharacterized protein n=1 Tax=Phytophthora megakarya TaxID=4795 RepID=A0A225ULE8_9STRA|nr:hypothetical protein PHMEG_00037255 [Phytophthora megakarya]